MDERNNLDEEIEEGLCRMCGWEMKDVF